MADELLERRKPCDCKHEGDIQMLKSNETSMQKALDGVNMKLDMILAQITKVAVLEEKHTYQGEALGRAFNKLGTMENELHELDRFRHRTEGMAKMAWILWVAIGSAVFALALKVFFGAH